MPMLYLQCPRQQVLGQAVVGRSPQKGLQRLQQGAGGSCVLLAGQRLQQTIVEGEYHASQGC